jgi:hypothetical protein
MASHSTANSSPIQGPSSVSPPPSASVSASVGPTSVPPAQQPSPSRSTLTPPVTPPANSPSPSTSLQTQAPSHQSTSPSALPSLSSTSQVSPAASQVAPAPTTTSQPQPSNAAPPSSSSSQPSLVGNGVSNPPRPDADYPVLPMRVVIPVASAVAGMAVFLLVYYFYRRYQRGQQLKEAPLPAKRTPAILEQRRAQSMYRSETHQTQNKTEYDSLMAPITFPLHHSGAGSYLSFPSSEASHTLDSAYTHPLPTPPASASAVSLERQPSTVSPPTPSDEFVKDPSLPGNYPPDAPPQFLQRPFTQAYTRRDPRLVARPSRPLSIASVASRHSTYSLAAMRSGQHSGSGSTLRGAPHRNTVTIVLPQPLAPNSRPNSAYIAHNEEPTSVHMLHMGSMTAVAPYSLTQGLPPWNEYGELRGEGNMPSDRTRGGGHSLRSLRCLNLTYSSVEWEKGYSGSHQGLSSSSSTMSHPGMSYSQSDPAAHNWRHTGTPSIGPTSFNVSMAPPVPPLPPLFQMTCADSRASGTSSQNTSTFLTPPTSLAHLRPIQQPSPPRSPLSRQVSIDEKIPELDVEDHTTTEPEELQRIPQSEGSASHPPLLHDSVFADPDGELKSATRESGRTSAVTHTRPPLTQIDEDIVRHAATPAAP